MSATSSLRVAVEGCGHGTLDAIYASVQSACHVRGWSEVDLVIIGGDFQAVRNQHDLNVTAMPVKYRQMADFHRYYSGLKTAPYLTIFIGGNHEASNHLFELYYGGWVAPNIYYLGAANVLRLGPLKIAGLSGIWKAFDYRKPHFERLPYSSDTMRSIYHTRELDVRKLLSYRSQVDIGMSHDWPRGIEWEGDHKALFRSKSFLYDDAVSGKLGNVAAAQVMDHLRPSYWFSAHLHWKYAAWKTYGASASDKFVGDPRSRNMTAHGTAVLDDEASTSQTSSAVIPSKMVQSPSDQATDRGAVAAWNHFATNVTAKDAQKNTDLVREREVRREATAERKPASLKAQFDETYKKIKLGDGSSRAVESTTAQTLEPREETIAQLDGSISPLLKKRNLNSGPDDDGLEHEALESVETQSYRNTAHGDAGVAKPLKGDVVANPDAIEVDLSDEDDELTENVEPALESEPINENAKDSPRNEAKIQQTETLERVPVHIQGQDTEPPPPDESEEIRRRLAVMSRTFAVDKAAETSPSLPHPSTIFNKQTRFLALSKCGEGKDFLQLLEVQPFCQNPDSFRRPLKLQYDPEWLAILRVFAPELALGGSAHDKAPPHRGDTYYRDRIAEEERWITENVVEKGFLQMPENFQHTAPLFDPSIDVDSSEMPRETTNPQTDAFCSLIGIENKFDFSEADRDARMSQGPPAEREAHGSSHRGHSRGRGRGGFGRGRDRGRGRGRGRGR